MSAKDEAEDILENIQPPLTLEDIDEKAKMVARVLTRNRIGFYALGMGVGAVTGYFIAKRHMETKYSKIADEEIEEMREHYQAKTRAFEAKKAKLPVEEIVKERGYSSEPENVSPPMAIQPPNLVMADDEDEIDTPENRQEVIDSLEEKPEVRNIFTEAQVNHEWNWHEERRNRSPDIPYVIHIDEREEMDFQVETLTYYEGDDVLCNQRDEIIDPDFERDNLIGEKNLERFGHGSNDPAIVYVRNDKLELIYEICRSPHKFAEEVHGFHHDSGYGGNLERMRSREHNEQED